MLLSGDEGDDVFLFHEIPEDPERDKLAEPDGTMYGVDTLDFGLLPAGSQLLVDLLLGRSWSPIAIEQCTRRYRWLMKTLLASQATTGCEDNRGTNQLQGGAGDDTYVFISQPLGTDLVIEVNADIGGIDTLDLHELGTNEGANVDLEQFRISAPSPARQIVGTPGS